LNARNLLARPFSTAPGATVPGTAVPDATPTADPEEAQDFLRQLYTEQPDQPLPFALRLRQVRRAIRHTGTYEHTGAELAFGARVAWRNAARCIGRLYWRGLRVLDRRSAATAEEIHRQLAAHLRQATHGGRIRPVISVFAPDTPLRIGPRVWNSQLIRYAGHRRPDGSTVGDPAQTGFTELVRALGWRAPGGPFDVLPLVIEPPRERARTANRPGRGGGTGAGPGGGPALFELDPADILEVELRHPRYPAFDGLGLRWHAVPVISHMRLRIGGIDYPLAPFNGWYMGTEIGARTLTDTDRYNLLPAIAERLGLDTSGEHTLWRDRALVEANIAVLHSFRAAGVKITDHHTESRHFLTHLAREERCGRPVPADWSWIVPPVSGGITPVFHRYYDVADLRPNFYLDPDARARAAGVRTDDGRTGGGPAQDAHAQDATRPERGTCPGTG
jgi:nitric-oxide synthase